MKKAEALRFEKLAEKAQQLNRKIRSDRFLIIHSSEQLTGKTPRRIPVYGLYDYKTKKYTLSEPFVDGNIIFDEMEEMLRFPRQYR